MPLNIGKIRNLFLETLYFPLQSSYKIDIIKKVRYAKELLA